MAEAPIRFRCYSCNKLLGAPARKAGSVVNCPQCRAELQIPAPEEPADAPSAPLAEVEVESAAAGPQAFGPPLPPDLESLRPEDIRVEPEFANLVVDPAQFRPAPKPSAPVQPDEPPEAPPADPAEKPDESPAATETLLVEAADEVVIPHIRVESPSISAREAPSRGASEVVLSSAVVLAWSLLVLLAIPLAFLAGLLTGHFLWK